MPTIFRFLLVITVLKVFKCCAFPLLTIHQLFLFALPGIAQFVNNFAEPGDPQYAPPVQKGETPVSLFYAWISCE